MTPDTKLHTMWVHVREILQQATQPTVTGSGLVVARVGSGRDSLQMGPKEVFGMMDTLSWMRVTSSGWWDRCWPLPCFCLCPLAPSSTPSLLEWLVETLGHLNQDFWTGKPQAGALSPLKPLRKPTLKVDGNLINVQGSLKISLGPFLIFADFMVSV